MTLTTAHCHDSFLKKVINESNPKSSNYSDPITKEAVGFIHDLSPLKNGDYVDFQIKTRNRRTLRGVCSSPVKITKFQLSKSHNTEDIIVNEETSLETSIRCLLHY